jgi:hypothetical protein
VKQDQKALVELTPALTLKIVENKEMERKKHSLSERSEFRMLRGMTRSFQIFEYRP